MVSGEGEAAAFGVNAAFFESRSVRGEVGRPGDRDRRPGGCCRRRRASPRAIAKNETAAASRRAVGLGSSLAPPRLCSGTLLTSPRPLAPRLRRTTHGTWRPPCLWGRLCRTGLLACGLPGPEKRRWRGSGPGAAPPACPGTGPRPGRKVAPGSGRREAAVDADVVEVEDEVGVVGGHCWVVRMKTSSPLAAGAVERVFWPVERIPGGRPGEQQVDAAPLPLVDVLVCR